MQVGNRLEEALVEAQERVRTLLAQGVKVAEALRRAADAKTREQYGLMLGTAELLSVELHAGIAQQRILDASAGVGPNDDLELRARFGGVGGAEDEYDPVAEELAEDFERFAGLMERER